MLMKEENEMTVNLIEGIYRDRLIGPRGEVLFDSDWKSNMIVLRCRILLAGFMKNEKALGIQSMKVGSGDAAWDNLSPPSKPDPNSLEKLVDNDPFVIPVGKLDLKYLDVNDAQSQTPTNRLQITATLGPKQPKGQDPYPLREFGLFGQMSLDQVNTDFMIDYIRHPLIEKDSLMTLERKVRLVF
jgi:hypothetical protein